MQFYTTNHKEKLIPRVVPLEKKEHTSKKSYEYYPFGLQTASSWTRENTTGNNFLYNAANELNQNSGWYEMFYRGYDPALGRMLQVDPYATSYASHTPYNYALNNPGVVNDPSGGYAQLSNGFGREMVDRAYENGWVIDFSSAFSSSSFSTGGIYRMQTAELGRTAYFRDLDRRAREGDPSALQEYGFRYGTTVTSAAFESGNPLGVQAGVWTPITGFIAATKFLPLIRAWGMTNYLHHKAEEQRRLNSLITCNEPNCKHGQKDPYDGHSFSVGGNIAFGGGVNFSIGVVWNKDGDWRIFTSGGPSFGFDASLGVVIKSITNNKNEPFNPNQYGGWGSSANVGLGPIDVVIIGGDNSPDSSKGLMGKTFTESGGGVSFGSPFGLTYQTSYTSFPFRFPWYGR